MGNNNTDNNNNFRPLISNHTPPILLARKTGESSMTVETQIDAFNNERQAGFMMAGICKAVLKQLAESAGANPDDASMEQAEASFMKCFTAEFIAAK